MNLVDAKSAAYGSHGVLIVEHDEELARTLHTYLEQLNYSVYVATTVHDAIVILDGRRPIDLVVLDLEWPDRNGLQILKEMKQRENPPAVIVVSAHSSEDDRVGSFRAGANDFVLKPLAFRELGERIRTRIRERAARTDKFRLGATLVDLREQTIVDSAGEHRRLTRQEVRFLFVMLEACNNPVDRRQLLKRVWGERSETSTRSLDHCVAQLRKKLEPDPRYPLYLVTVRGTGYQLNC